ncbi:MbeD/MobD family mobilization/exclusion protein [Turicimonas sp. TL08]
MNIVSLVKASAGILLVLCAYFFGLNQGKNSEELKNARSQVSQLTQTIQEYETRQKDWNIAMADLRKSESLARSDSERLRQRVNSLEKRAKTSESRIAIQCLRLEPESRKLLQEARGIIEYCRKALQ